ncbi:MAG: beta-ketoacyl-ACP synthase II [bacterium]|nr:beta-ketoacyl-ACP synthase II [bacterium]
MTKRRVVITGLGVITPVGLSVKETWEALVAGKSGAGNITYFDTTDYTTKIAAEVKGFVPENYLDPKEAKRLEKFVCFSIAATKEAIADAGLNLDQEDLNRFGVIVGSGIGGLGLLERQHTILLEKGPRRVSPFLIPMMIINMASGMISMIYKLKGPNTAVATACATGAHAIGDAFKIIQRGDAEVMVCGGTEATITPIGIAGFCSMKAMSTRNDEPQKASRPFDAKRDGFVMGEGSGVVILESLDHARQRNARIYAEIAGYGLTADAYHITAPAPEGEGAARAMALAIQDAGLNPEQVDYINAHGTSTDLNDKFETIAIKKVFGDQAYKLAVSSTKSMIGHLLGAAGGVEFVVCVLSIVNNKLTPTINYEFPDPDCDLDYVPNQARDAQVNTAISNSLGFGGHNATLLVKRFE